MITRPMRPTRSASAVVVVAATLLLTLLATPAQAASLPGHRAWLKDTRAAMAGSRTFIDHRVAAPGERLAVNLDIDNTALQSHYRTGRATPVVLRFARYAAAHDVAVVINTGRTGGLERVAARLRAVGYPVAAICGRVPGETLPQSKQRCRQQYVDAGWTIIANVGNRSTDFEGGNYERAFKLPDYRGRLS